MSAGAGVFQAPAAPAEFALSQADFREIAAMLHEDAGIHLAGSKASLVYARLARRLRALGLSSFRDYCALVKDRKGLDERQRMLAALTTNVTGFFREPHHFAHLERVVLPPLLEAAGRGARVRLWSAGCSSGPEAYSMAMAVLSLRPDAARLDVRILATDVDPDVIGQAREGVYDERAAAGLSAPLRERWTKPTPSPKGAARRLRVADEPRALISFRELNLNAAWPMKGPFQAIFCRNVAIYFEEQTQMALWSRFPSMLAPGGRLYIGHSERLNGPAARAFVAEGVTHYRLAGRSGA
ncbi:protein-glutamate O-methyltransferase [Methylocella sp.]|uniref:protein-glutamate O-methyltransferase n=1 Tax=Methylocella sp. TaxID=1978226 RepID=UPI0037846FB1